MKTREELLCCCQLLFSASEQIRYQRFNKKYEIPHFLMAFSSLKEYYIGGPYWGRIVSTLRLEGNTMATSYKKLWHILVDREMKKKELQERANLTHYQMTKLAHGEDITTDVLGRICQALDVKADDILEFSPDKR